MNARHLLSLAALLLFAACVPRGTDQTEVSIYGYQSAEPAAAIGADIAAARRTAPAAGSPVSSPIAAPESIVSSLEIPEAPITARVPSDSGSALVNATGSGDASVGKSFAQNNCRPCHVVVRDQSRPLRFGNAPEFWRIASDVRTTPLSLKIWLTNPHPTMPSLQLTPAEAADVVAYIMSLRS